MLTQPADLPDEALAAILNRDWAVDVASLAYRAVGFGSHHWELVDTQGTRWFVTVDDLPTKAHTRDEPLDEPFHRLAAALRAAQATYDHGHAFVVPPVPATNGQALTRTGRYAVALYPFVDGRSFAWGEWADPEHRHAVLDMLVALHGTPVDARRDRLRLPLRDALEAALASPQTEDTGPYAHRAAALVHEHTKPLRHALATYDTLVAQARPERAVLTHGEPHPGNTMRTADGWRLIDWDTALLAPPERDLWNLDPGDGSVLTAYEAATGVTPVPEMLALYGLRWALYDITQEVDRFRHPHGDTEDGAMCWRILSDTVGDLAKPGTRTAL